MGGYGKKFCVIAYKHLCKRISKREGKHSQNDAESADDASTFFEKTLQFAVISGTKMEADNRSTANRVADKNGNENKLYIH